MCPLRSSHSLEDEEGIDGGVNKVQEGDLSDDAIYVDLTSDEESQAWMTGECTPPKTALSDYSEEELAEIANSAREKTSESE